MPTDSNLWPCPVQPVRKNTRYENRRKHIMMNISTNTVWNWMKFRAPEYSRLRESTIKMREWGNWWVLRPRFEDQSEKFIIISFQETAWKEIHFTFIYDDYQVKWLFEIPPNHTAATHSLVGNERLAERVFHYENAWNLDTFLKVTSKLWRSKSLHLTLKPSKVAVFHL